MHSSTKSLSIVAVDVSARVFTVSIGFRRLGGKLAHFDDLGAGKSRQHLLHPRIGFGGALALVLLRLRSASAASAVPASLDTITVQRRPVHCSSLRDRSLISVRARAALQRHLEPAVLDAHQPDIGFQRRLGQQVALFAGQRHQFGKARDPERRRGCGLRSATARSSAAAREASAPDRGGMRARRRWLGID